jgi:putative ABC transport system permease protein
MAKKYFGNEDPMNKMIRMNNQFNLKVTGVYKEFPSNSHIHPEMMVSFNTIERYCTVYGDGILRQILATILSSLIYYCLKITRQ